MRYGMSDNVQEVRRASWELRLTRREIEALKREREHLNSKAQERPLTTWERFRQQEIFQEVSALLKRVRRLGRDESLIH